MKSFLVVMLVLAVIGTFARVRYLSGTYPRTHRIRWSEDLIGLVIQSGMLVWIINLLDGL